MSRQMSQSERRENSAAATHVQMGSTAINYTTIARGVCYFMALYVIFFLFLRGISIEFFFSFLYFFFHVSLR